MKVDNFLFSILDHCSKIDREKTIPGHKLKHRETHNS